MCTTCGCGHGQTRIDGAAVPAHGATPYRHADPEAVPRHRHADGTWHGGLHRAVAPPGPPLSAIHDDTLPAARVVAVEQDILARNDAIAARNRSFFAERAIFVANLVSSPGSGKTSLLVRTIEALAGRLGVAVVEGDQQTSLDADRIRATGAPAVQVNTGRGCHLDASMVERALAVLSPPDGSVVLIENVGNLVCPAAFDLGEAHKVVILSVTEGDDKPLKYPDMFHAADLMVINKVDLAPYVTFDVGAAIANARRIRPGLPALTVSATTGEGFDAWLAWIAAGSARARAARDAGVAAHERRAAEPPAQLAATGRAT